MIGITFIYILVILGGKVDGQYNSIYYFNFTFGDSEKHDETFEKRQCRERRHCSIERKKKKDEKKRRHSFRMRGEYSLCNTTKPISKWKAMEEESDGWDIYNFDSEQDNVYINKLGKLLGSSQKKRIIKAKGSLESCIKSLSLI